MAGKVIEIKTKDGIATCHFFAPPENENRPAVIFYMDVFGVRPALVGMAERLASHGYYVLLPNLYYRSGFVPAFYPATVFADPTERAKIMPFMQAINQKLIMEDTAAYLDFLKAQPAIKGQKIGCVGYCMGGPYALSAAGTFPARIAAAASFHGARLATDQPDSPHLLAPKMQSAIYVGIAGIDPHFTPEEKQRLKSALEAAGVKHTIEVYPGSKHGFAVTDTPSFDHEGSERHWDRLLKLFAENL